MFKKKSIRHEIKFLFGILLKTNDINIKSNKLK